MVAGISLFGVLAITLPAGRPTAFLGPTYGHERTVLTAGSLSRSAHRVHELPRLSAEAFDAIATSLPLGSVA